MNRRGFAGVAAGLVGGAAILKTQAPPSWLASDQRPARSRVAILTAAAYSDKLDGIVYDGLRLFNLSLQGKTVLLKPNLVEYIPGAEVNTNPWLVHGKFVLNRRVPGRSNFESSASSRRRDGS